MADEFTFDVMESCGVLSEENNGWKKELTIVSWNRRNPKYDIRSWAPEKKRMGRGITFTRDELTTLKNLLNNLPIEQAEQVAE